MNEYNIFTLKNGLRVIHKEVKRNQVSHCGLIIDAGTRDEEENEAGMAHFIEHCIFKGTKKRKAFHILSRLDAVGGELNAFTTKEETCIYASFLNRHFQRAIELIADITFNSTFPEKEIQREKEVVIDEIYSYLDSPSEQIIDDFEHDLFQGHPLGKNIFGTIESIRAFTPEAVKTFMQNNYTPEKMVLSVVGSISLNKVRKYAERYFSDFSGTSSKKPTTKGWITNKPFEKIVEKNTFQNHIVLGSPSFAIGSPQRTTMFLLNNYLGGPAMNNKLSMLLREKHGIAYNIESIYQDYSDQGIFMVYLGTDRNQIDKSIKLIKKELKKVCETKLGVRQLNLAKQQLIGQIALAHESGSNVMLGIGKGLLRRGSVMSSKETFDAVERIKAEDILSVANSSIHPDKQSLLIFK